MTLKFRLASFLIILNSKSVELIILKKNLFVSVIVSISIRRYWVNRKGSAGWGRTHEKAESYSIAEWKSGPGFQA